MKTLIIATLILASVNCYSQKKPIDTTTSKTKIYMALNTRNSFFKRDEYEVKGSNHMNFTAVVLHNLTNELIIKGARLYAYGSIFSSTQGAIGTYFDTGSGTIKSIIKPKPLLGFQLLKMPDQEVGDGRTTYVITLLCDIIFSPGIEYSFEAKSITTLVNTFKPMRISVLESITEDEIPLLEEMLNKDLQDKNIRIHVGLKLDVPEGDIISMIQLAVDQFEA